MPSPLLLILATVLIAPAAALAQSGSAGKMNDDSPNKPPSKVERFRTADKDGDGALTREEAGAAGMDNITDNFDQLDRNKDGKVTPEEMRSLIRSKLFT